MLDALTLDQLRTFVAIAEAQSFRAAAGRLSRVQSAVSQAIANLETELGIRLFDRSGYRPALTPEGRALLADARAILLKVDAMRARARGLGEGLELRLAIALDPQFPIGLAAAALKDLHNTYPSVSVSMCTAPLGATIVALREGRCALAITAADLPDPRIELESLLFVPRAAVAAATHPLAVRSRDGAPLTAAELADHLQVVVPDPSPLTEGRDFGVLSPGTWQVSDNATKHALILAGVGWGSLPLWLIERDLADARLVRIATAEFGRQGETFVRAYLAHRTDQALGPAARAFRQALLQRADGSANPRSQARDLAIPRERRMPRPSRPRES
jgi:DNA-binding transcriptional LysR family regulator